MHSSYSPATIPIARSQTVRKDCREQSELRQEMLNAIRQQSRLLRQRSKELCQEAEQLRAISSALYHSSPCRADPEILNVGNFSITTGRS